MKINQQQRIWSMPTRSRRGLPYRSPQELGDNRLDRVLAVDLEIVALDVEADLVTVPVDLVKAAQGRGCLDPEDWPLYHQTNCLAHAQWQEERVDSHLHEVLDH